MRGTSGSFQNDTLPNAGDDFAGVLRGAVAQRGLGLERIKARLDGRGTPVSVATLSYWCSGRSQPERKASLAALPHLETILGLPRDTLLRSLTGPRERGRRRDVARLETVWPEGAHRRVLGQLDTTGDTDLERLSVHDLLTFDAHRGELSMVVREVVRARNDGIDKRVVLHCVDDRAAAPPVFTAHRGCRVGRTVADPDGTFGAELLFLRPLRRGETAVLEYAIAPTLPRPVENSYARRFRFPIREYVLQVRFAPEALPAKCETLGEGDTHRPLELDPAHTVHLVEVDCAPGERGIRWNWPEADIQVNC